MLFYKKLLILHLVQGIKCRKKMKGAAEMRISEAAEVTGLSVSNAVQGMFPAYAGFHSGTY